MRTHVIKIGNSQGLDIPKPILEQTGIVDDVGIELGEIRSLSVLLKMYGKAGTMPLHGNCSAKLEKSTLHCALVA